jgi:hypothetical protein
MTPDAGFQSPTLEQLLALGRGLMPCNERKKAIFEWKHLQRRLPTSAELAGWKKLKPSCWAMITGQVSGVLTLDFDGELGVELLRKLGVEPHRQTPSGAYHADFAAPNWHVKTLNYKKDPELGRRWPGLDIRASGGYVCVLGRAVHDEDENGHYCWGEYRWLRSPEPHPTTILPEEMREFFGLIHPPVEKPPEERPAEARPANIRRWIDKALGNIIAQGGRNNAGFWLAGQLRDDNVSYADAEAAMRDYASQCGGLNAKKKSERYTEKEMLASLRSAYGIPARSPAKNMSRSGGKGRATMADASNANTSNGNANGSSATEAPPPKEEKEEPSAESSASWERRLIVTDKGKLAPCIENVALMLENEPEWAGVLGYNEFTGGYHIMKPPPEPVHIRHRAASQSRQRFSAAYHPISRQLRPSEGA